MAEELSGRGAEFAVEFLVAFDFRHRPAEAFQGFRANLSAVRGFSAAMGSRWVHKRFGEHSGPLPRPFPSRVRFRAASVSEPRPFPSRDRQGAVSPRIPETVKHLTGPKPPSAVLEIP